MVKTFTVVRRSVLSGKTNDRPVVDKAKLNRDLAVLQLLKRESVSVITTVVRRCRSELIDLNSSNYVSKCHVLASQIDLYLDHLNNLQGRIGISPEQIEAEKRRWRFVQLKIRELRPEQINAFKIELEKVFLRLSIELGVIGDSIDDKMKAIRAKAA